MWISPLTEREIKTAIIIKRLLKAKGIKKYVILDAIDEASEVLPGGIFPVSGEILTDKGKIYHYWLDWDEKKQDYSLGDVTLPDGTVDDYWREADEYEYSQSQKDPYYQIARKRLGLSFDQQYVTPITRAIRAELESLVKLHTGRYASAPPIVSGLDQELPETIAEISGWNTTITNWAKEYLQGIVTFRDHDLQEAGKHSILLGSKLYGFRNKTSDQAYNTYIDWRGSLSILLTKLDLLANLEGKVHTILTEKE